MLRHQQTPEESILWQRLRNRKLNGFRFVRQFSVDQFVLDFYCPDCLLGIEIDGSQHFTDEGRKNDAERTKMLETRNIRVIRFRNDEIRDSLDVVVEAIHVALQDQHSKKSPS